MIGYSFFCPFCGENFILTVEALKFITLVKCPKCHEFIDDEGILVNE